MILYQNPVRHTINEQIFHKPTAYCMHEGKKYQIIIKDKKIGPISQKRAQVIGIEDISIIDGLAKQIEQTIPDLIYIQFGICVQVNADSENLQELKNKIAEQSTENSHVTFVPSIVENMPEATIIIDTSQVPEVLLQGIGSTHQRWIKKAQKSGGKYVELWENEVDHAYDMRHKTSKKQGFTIPIRDHFKQLYHLLVDGNKGFFAAWKQGDEVGAFAVIVTIGDTRFYLYGGSDSNVGVGSAQSLHWQIMQNAHRKGVKTYDLLGVSPLGKTDHHLAGVTQFKQGFGGQRVEYVGNYDYLISGWKYRLYKLRRNLRK